MYRGIVQQTQDLDDLLQNGQLKFVQDIVLTSVIMYAVHGQGMKLMKVVMMHNLHYSTNYGSWWCYPIFVWYDISVVCTLMMMMLGWCPSSNTYSSMHKTMMLIWHNMHTVRCCDLCSDGTVMCNDLSTMMMIRTLYHEDACSMIQDLDDYMFRPWCLMTWKAVLMSRPGSIAAVMSKWSTLSMSSRDWWTNWQGEDDEKRWLSNMLMTVCYTLHSWSLIKLIDRMMIKAAER